MDKVVSPVSNCKYLGIHLDDRLTFKYHIQHINSKISRHTGLLYKTKDNLPIKTRLEFYYAYIYPFLSYNTIIWGCAYSTHIQPLFVQQKRTVRIIANAGFRDHTDPLFKQLKILKLEDIYNFQLGTFMYQARQRGEYASQSSIHTRWSNDSRPSRHRILLTQHAVSYAGPKFWNSLPPHLRSINSYKKFRKSLEDHLIAKY